MPRGRREQTPFVALFERAEPKLDKSKCPDWKRDNAERYRLFEVPKKPEVGERERDLKRKREKLARVQERLLAPDVRPGMRHELLKHEQILTREIAELVGNLGILEDAPGKSD